MDYEYPTLLADDELKRLHICFPIIVNTVSPVLAERRDTCDFGGGETPMPVVPFMEAVRLINEEAYRPCGNCLMEGGEVSNWKERAERAEADVRGLNSQLEQSDALAADWKERAESAEQQLRDTIELVDDKS